MKARKQVKKPAKKKSALPVCPLCGKGVDEYTPGMVQHDENRCRLSCFCFDVAEWRRLAAPPLPETVREVLEACEIELTPQEEGDPEVRVGTLWNALHAWRAAGRPGIEAPK